MAPLDLEELRIDIHRKHSPEGLRDNDQLAAKCVSDADLMSSAMYPKVRPPRIPVIAAMD
jgi:hypothetical protein